MPLAAGRGECCGALGDSRGCRKARGKAQKDRTQCTPVQVPSTGARVPLAVPAAVRRRLRLRESLRARQVASDPFAAGDRG